MEEVRKNELKLLAQSAFAIAIFMVFALLTGGYASQSMTNPPSSATEELLLSTATGRALSTVDLHIFAGRKVFLNSNFFDSYDSKM